MKRHAATARLLAVLLAATLSGCASQPSPNQAYDPIEPVNRGLYTFNEGLDTYALAPVAQGWTAITTEGIRQRVDNVFENLAYPGVILNDFLQGKPEKGTAGIGRFLINSSVGLAGIFDPATTLGIEQRSEDFGQTLGVWGASSGAYLTLPLFGPSSTRDVTRYPVAWFTDVLAYVSMTTATAGAVLALDVINTRAQLERAVRIRAEAAVDPYVFTRSAYLQSRYNAVHDGDPPGAAQDPYGDFFEDAEGGDASAPAEESD